MLADGWAIKSCAGYRYSTPRRSTVLACTSRVTETKDNSGRGIRKQIVLRLTV